MIIDRSDEIIDSSPDSVWNTRKINKVFNSLDTAINTTLDSQLLTVNGTQTIQGQKTFSNMYVSDTSGLSYESAMSFLQNDISPVINTGAKGISTDVVKELSFSKDNVSGVVAPVSSLLPVYRKSSIEVRWGVAGTSTVEYDIKNCPVYTTNASPFLASTSTIWPLAQNNRNTLKYVTSVSASGTIVGTGAGFFDNPLSAAGLFVYLTDQNTVGVVLVRTIGLPLNVTPTSGSRIKAFSRVGLKVGQTFTPIINLNNTVHILDNSYRLIDVIFGGASYILFGESITCSIEFRQDLSTNNNQIAPSVSSDNQPLYNLGSGLSKYYGKSSEFLDLPLIYNPIARTFITNSALTFNNFPLGLSLVRRITF
jgi:hypothetical protein